MTSMLKPPFQALCLRLSPIASHELLQRHSSLHPSLLQLIQLTKPFLTPAIIIIIPSSAAVVAPVDQLKSTVLIRECTSLYPKLNCIYSQTTKMTPYQVRQQHYRTRVFSVELTPWEDRLHASHYLRSNCSNTKSPRRHLQLRHRQLRWHSRTIKRISIILWRKYSLTHQDSSKTSKMSPTAMIIGNNHNNFNFSCNSKTKWDLQAINLWIHYQHLIHSWFEGMHSKIN